MHVFLDNKIKNNVVETTKEFHYKQYLSKKSKQQNNEVFTIFFLSKTRESQKL
jgi:hypothetical protein